MVKRLAKFHHSIFVKLIFILLCIGLMVLIAVSLFYKSIMGDRFETIAQKNINNYARYIVDDIGIPPDTIKAKTIAKQLSINIRYENAEFSWSTSPDIPPISEIPENERYNYQTRPGMGWMRHRYFIVTNNDGSQFAIVPDIGGSVQNHHFLFFAMLLLLSAIFLVTFFLIRHILKPVRWLDTGVKKIAAGDLNYQIPEGKKDELGDLTRAFNQMTRRIREMLHARDQLLIDVSHELRSPITRMRVALEFLPDSKNKTFIQNDIDEIEVMITEILENERLKKEFGQLVKEETDIVNLIRETADPFKDVPPGIVLRGMDHPVNCSLDRKRIQIVIKNLLDNACKYSKRESKPVEIFLEVVKNSVKLTVIDNGIGIPDDEIPYVFEPFYRVDRSRSKKSGGYGLGLSLCRRIIEAHGGTIAIENNPHGGTRVVIILPLSDTQV